MGNIKPEIGAIANYLWVTAQEGIALSISAVRDAQTLINPDYYFDVHQNMYRPSIEDLVGAFVNIHIASATSADGETNFNKTHIVTYNIDCYVLGKNEDDADELRALVPADEAAVQRLQYLCAMVEYALTKLAGFYKGLNSGQIVPDKIDLTFNPVDDAAESATPYAPARFQFVCKFPYNAADLTGLPALEKAFIDMSKWSSLVNLP